MARQSAEESAKRERLAGDDEKVRQRDRDKGKERETKGQRERERGREGGREGERAREKEREKEREGESPFPQQTQIRLSACKPTRRVRAGPRPARRQAYPRPRQSESITMAVSAAWPGRGNRLMGPAALPPAWLCLGHVHGGGHGPCRGRGGDGHGDRLG